MWGSEEPVRSREEETGKDLKRRYARVAKKVRAAVDAGRVSEEDGKERLESYRKRLFGWEDGGERDPRTRYSALAAEIEAAVDAGKMTEADGRKKLAAFGERLREERNGASVETLIK